MSEYVKNTILYGPPGTGKTFNIIKRAVDICLGGKPENDQEYNKIYEELVNDGRIQFITFHQSYGYEDFIEGIRPVMDGKAGELRYEVRDGVFKAFCRTAEKALEECVQNHSEYQFSIEEGHDVRLMDVGIGVWEKGSSDIINHWEKNNVISIRSTDYNKKKFMDFKTGDYIIVRNSKENENRKMAVGIARISDNNFTDSKDEKFNGFIERKVEWLYLDESNPLDIEANRLFP